MSKPSTRVMTITSHRGFWSAYLPARKFLHDLLRKELSKNPATVYFTGHSLGGALTTLAAFDISVHTLPRINDYLAAKKRSVIFLSETGQVIFASSS
jgi:putative lipase involved disintegration of autophagic bodies